MGGQQAKQLFPVPGKQRVGFVSFIIAVLCLSNMEKQDVPLVIYTPN